MTFDKQTIEACLEEMGTEDKTTIKIPVNCLPVINRPNPIPIENIKLIYEQVTNKSWEDEYGPDRMVD